jgi:hypothetical protein
MKSPLAIIAAAAVTLLAIAPAQARHHGARAQASPSDLRHAYAAHSPYPWCVKYNNMTGYCGFESFAQCIATARGNGGTCSGSSHPMM